MAVNTLQQGNPRVGMLPTVRNRRGIITAVEPQAGRDQEQYHLVSVEYADGDGQPEDTLIWEREPEANLLEPTALPEVDAAPPLRPDEFDALVRATRWGALTPHLPHPTPAPPDASVGQRRHCLPAVCRSRPIRQDTAPLGVSNHSVTIWRGPAGAGLRAATLSSPRAGAAPPICYPGKVTHAVEANHK